MIEPQTLLERAEAIQRSARQLYRLVKLDAPPLIIEGARHVLAKRIVAFPVDAAALATNESIRLAMEKEQHDFLLAHGFYDEIIKEMNEAEGLDDPAET